MTTIKKITLLALTALLMVGCDALETNIPSEETDLEIGGWKGCIYVFDSCEYIKLGHGITHKGNCRFCKECRQKELEELVIKLKEK